MAFEGACGDAHTQQMRVILPKGSGTRWRRIDTHATRRAAAWLDAIVAKIDPIAGLLRVFTGIGRESASTYKIARNV
ncbi:hypothetical protein [Burkholderia pseudomultivorans]|uniref:hypothetical protein n=1 Tax=Burkholderia pseudomultivorans TaxID=1207504 RepID=UPI0012DAF12A|nr:hypothetical protein [Burkholderia pseudomultivorans]